MSEEAAGGVGQSPCPPSTALILTNSGDAEFDAVVKDTLTLIANVLADKQRDYGRGNISAFGEIGVLVRASDKMERLKNLYRKGVAPRKESVADTWLDLAGYGIIGMICHAGRWPGGNS